MDKKGVLKMAREVAVPKSKKSSPVTMVVILLVFGLIFGGFGYYKYNMGKESVSWPTIKGTMMQARAVPKKLEHSNEYQLFVKYTYTVDGKSYTGNHITAFDEYQKTLSRANDVLKKYPVGGEVSVYYDPADPGLSVLETGATKNVSWLLWVGVICFFLATAIIVSEVKKKILK